MQVGDVIQQTFKFDDNTSGYWRGCRMRTLTGTVVYIHPLRRFYVLEFKLPGGTFRQSFTFKEVQNKCE